MRITSKELRGLPTLCTAQCCSLKRETNTERVWLCRVGGGVTIEQLDVAPGRWVVVAGSCNATVVLL